MAATRLLWLSLFMLVHFQCGDTRTQLMTVIEALEKLVLFYKSSYKDFNVDGLFGLRVVEGHVQLLLNEHNQGQHQHITSDVLERLRRLVRDATQVSNQALEYVRRDDESYYNQFKFIVGSPWAVYKKHRGIDPKLKWLPKVYREQKEGKLNEELSDQCMGEMTGASHKDGRSCVISETCVEAMIQKGLTEYSLTHQILWTMMAEKAGCLQELKQILQDQGYPTVESLQLEFCTNNYYEMLAVVHIYMKGIINPEYQDLFLEQQFVCPSIGFYEHLTHDYLTQVLSWQLRSGCFGTEHSRKAKKSVERMDAVFNGTWIEERPKGIVISHKKTTPTHIQAGQKVSSKRNYARSESLKFKQNKNDAIKPVLQKPVRSPRLVNDLTHRKNVNNFYQQSIRGQHLVKSKPVLNNAKRLGENQVPRGALQGLVKDKSLDGGQRLPHIHQPVAVNPDLAVIGHRGRNLLARKTMRKLLVEKTMRGGCYSHKTAVGAGALVMYLRYLIDPGPLDLNATHRNLPESSRSLLEKPDVGLGDSQKVKREGLIPVQDKLNEEDLKQMVPALEDRDGEDVGPDGGEGGDAGEQSEEYDGEEEDEDEYDNEGGDGNTYEDKDMYPDREENMPDQKIVHFGADKKHNLHRMNQLQLGRLANHMDPGFKGDNQQGNEEDTEYTYYDEPDNEFKHNMHESKDNHPVKIQQQSKRNSFHERRQIQPGSKNNEEPLGKITFIFFSASFLLLFFLMYRFIKKRRIHIRYHPRTIFNM